MNAQKKSPERFSQDKANSGVRIGADTKHLNDIVPRSAPRLRVYAVYHDSQSQMVHEGELITLAHGSALLLDVFCSRVNAELLHVTSANAEKLLLLGCEARIKQEDEFGNHFIVTISLYGTKKQAELKLQRLFNER